MHAVYIQDLIHINVSQSISDLVISTDVSGNDVVILQKQASTSKTRTVFS